MLRLLKSDKVFNSLVLEYDASSEAEVQKFVSDFSAGLYEIKKAGDKRSLRANRYLWEMIGKIAWKLKKSDIDVYRDAIADVGVYDVYHIYPEELESFTRDWSKMGLGWQAKIEDFAPDGETLLVRAYKGSSAYNKEQFGRLLDWINQEASQLDIPTQDEAYLNQLLEWWANDGQKSL